MNDENRTIAAGRSSFCLLVSLSLCLLVSDFVLRPSSFVRSHLRIKNKGNGVGRARGLRLEQLVDAGDVAALAPVPYPLSPVPCRVPVDQQLPSLGVSQQRDRPDLLIGVRD